MLLSYIYGLNIDYEEQVLTTDIKANIQCRICHVLPKEKEIVIKSWDLQIHESTWA